MTSLEGGGVIRSVSDPSILRDAISVATEFMVSCACPAASNPSILFDVISVATEFMAWGAAGLHPDPLVVRTRLIMVAAKDGMPALPERHAIGLDGCAGFTAFSTAKQVLTSSGVGSKEYHLCQYVFVCSVGSIHATS